MKRTISWAALCGLLTLAACSTTDEQVNLRKAGYDTIQAYNVAAPLAKTYIGSAYATPAVVAQIKADSARATTVITTLGADLQSANPVTALEVSAATVAVAALQSDIAKGAPVVVPATPTRFSADPNDPCGPVFAVNCIQAPEKVQ